MIRFHQKRIRWFIQNKIRFCWASFEYLYKQVSAEAPLCELKWCFSARLSSAWQLFERYDVGPLLIIHSGMVFEFLLKERRMKKPALDLFHSRWVQPKYLLSMHWNGDAAIANPLFSSRIKSFRKTGFKPVWSVAAMTAQEHFSSSENCLNNS